MKKAGNEPGEADVKFFRNKPPILSKKLKGDEEFSDGCNSLWS